MIVLLGNLYWGWHSEQKINKAPSRRWSIYMWMVLCGAGSFCLLWAWHGYFRTTPWALFDIMARFCKALQCLSMPYAYSYFINLIKCTKSSINKSENYLTPADIIYAELTPLKDVFSVVFFFGSELGFGN